MVIAADLSLKLEKGEKKRAGQADACVCVICAKSAECVCVCAGVLLQVCVTKRVGLEGM